MLQASIGSPLLWLGFLAFVLVMLAVDLGVFHRKSHEVGLKEAAIWSAVWVALAALFGVGVYVWAGADKALEFTTGYLLEKALAIDNIFVFVVIFAAFAVPAAYQHRVLLWGVLGALVMRAAFIFAGAALLQRFHWTIYLFGAILAITGVKLLRQRDHAVTPESNPVVRAFRRILPVTPDFVGDKFFVRRDGRRWVTPLLLTLVAVEVSDLVFAVDSIPAIFAVTLDPFIVFTSNVFAILGLRSLYFLLAGVIGKFRYLKVGLAVVLIFVGAKMLLLDVYKLPIAASLAIIAGILTVAVLASLRRSAPPPRSLPAEASRG
jgi:tellurite resistance protein TerC